MAYNNFPPAGYGARPGMPYAPPGANSTPLGMPSQSPANIPGQFQAPPNMPAMPSMPNLPPNINFAAPVIRMGMPDSRQDRGYAANRGNDRRGSNVDYRGGGRAGVGGRERDLDRERQAVRENMMALAPPTREEVSRTIFVGSLGKDAPDDRAIETILRSAGKLRRWTRAVDAQNGPCKFGFAEYEDAESLEVASEILPDLEVPIFKNGMVVKVEQERITNGSEVKAEEGESEDKMEVEDGEPRQVKTEEGEFGKMNIDGAEREGNEDGAVKKMKLLVVVDDASKKYIEDWMGRRNEAPEAREFRLENCKEDLRQCLASLINMHAFGANGSTDSNGDIHVAEIRLDSQNGEVAQVVTIPLGLEDDLSDIPTEARPTVAAEILAFRDRSARRDIDRMRHDAELEQASRNRASASGRPSSAQGPFSSSNNIPVGPRGGPRNAPSGPRGFRSVQMPSDYSFHAKFFQINGIRRRHHWNENFEGSAEELDGQIIGEVEAEFERIFNERVNAMRSRERHRQAAKEREKTRDESIKRDRQRKAATLVKRLRDYDDAKEMRNGRDDFYNDRITWAHRRAAIREREKRRDDANRREWEHREKDEQRQEGTARAREQADDFLDQTAKELAQQQPNPAKPLGFKLFTAKSTTSKVTPASRRTAADIEGILDDVNEAAAATSHSKSNRRAPAGEEEDIRAVQARVAAELPSSLSELLDYPIDYRYLTPTLLDQRIRPFVEKRVVEFLGVQEDVLVDSIMKALHDAREGGSKGPKALVELLDEALGEESEIMVKKVWRMAVFCSIIEGKGLGGTL